MEQENGCRWHDCPTPVDINAYQRMSVWVYCHKLRQQGRWLEYILERIRLRRIARRKLV